MNPRHFMITLLLLLVLPAAAQARLPDPVAYKCYYCTPEEREAVALDMGEGEHYIYDARITNGIFGYRVVQREAGLVAEAFEPEYWLLQQYSAMMRAYHTDDDTFRFTFGTLALFPPGGSHGRSDTRLWGFHLSALHPLHQEARRTVKRLLDGLPMLSFLEGDTEGGGRVLRFWFQLDGSHPLTIRLSFIYPELGSSDFYFDHENRRWEYLDSRDAYNVIQESREDFVGPMGQRTFSYPSTYSSLQPYFIRRAELASIEVKGELPQHGNVKFVCDEAAGTPVCYIQ